MYWIVMVVLVILAFFVLRIRHFKNKIFFFIIVLVALFIFITVSSVVTNYSVDLKSVDGIERGFKIYFSWLGGAFDNFKSITGSAVKMDWKFENETSEIIKAPEKK